MADKKLSVTAAQIEAAAGGFDALKGRVDAHDTTISEKLPKSPTDWEQWTADEQKAARERIGSEQWDLICDVELMEEATKIFVEKDINGNSFELEKIYMEQYVPHSDKSGQTALEFNLPNNTGSPSFYLVVNGGMSTTDNKTSRGFVHKIANTWFTNSLLGIGSVAAWCCPLYMVLRFL